MSTPPTAKRRRLSASNSALHKPFRSPLKAPKPTTTTTTSAASPPTRPRQQPYTPHRSSTLKSTHTIQTPTTPAPDTEVVKAQKRIRELEAQARDLRNQIAILSQAASISVPTPAPITDTQPQPRSSRLHSLTTKWRLASQAAADTIFPDFSARIKDAGGFSHFHANTTFPSFQDEEDADSGDEEGWRDELGEVLTMGEKARRRKMRGKKREGEEREEETELTMGKMLRVLGIEVGVVGWDEKGQMWLS